MKKKPEVVEDDFGFSSTSQIITNKNKQPGKQRSIEERFKKIEELILPLLQNLRDTADKPMINWPNRKPELDEKIEELLKLTRGQ